MGIAGNKSIKTRKLDEITKGKSADREEDY